MMRKKEVKIHRKFHQTYQKKPAASSSARGKQTSGRGRGGRGRGRGKTPPKPVPVLNKNMKRPAAAEIPPAKKTKKQEAVRTKKDHAFGFSLVCNACFSVISS